MYIIESLKAKNNFTSAESSLADYILKDLKKTLKMTLQEVCDGAYISKPTLIRLYRKLGYETYRNFKLALQEEVLKLSEETIINSNYPFANNDNVMNIAQNVASLTKQIVDSCYSLIDEREFKKAVDYLYGANRIFIFALGDCFIEAKAFINKLLKLNKYAVMLNENAYSYVNVFNLERGDVVLIISSTGKTLKIEKDTLRLLKDSPAKTILITTSTDLILREHYNCILRINNGEHDTIKLGNIASQISVVYTLNVLHSSIFALDYEKNVNNNADYYEFLKKVSSLK